MKRILEETVVTFSQRELEPCWNTHQNIWTSHSFRRKPTSISTDTLVCKIKIVSIRTYIKSAHHMLKPYHPQKIIVRFSLFSAGPVMIISTWWVIHSLLQELNFGWFQHRYSWCALSYLVPSRGKFRHADVLTFYSQWLSCLLIFPHLKPCDCYSEGFVKA